MNDIRLRVISLGAGVQSTALALMATRGELGPMPDCAIFADTGWEPDGVYRHLDWLERQLPFPVYRVTFGDLRADVLDGYRAKTKRTSSPPFFTRDERGPSGMLPRQCTKEYKVQPIRAKVRELMGLEARQRGPKHIAVEQWIGISTDEASRMKPAEQPWIAHRWPLIEKRLSRWDCLRWLERNGYPQPPKSACIGCPYHDDAFWRDLRDNAPADWRDAVEFDREIRTGGRGMLLTPFLHRSCVPLDQVDLSTAEDRGQLSLFNDECEGMCGV